MAIELLRETPHKVLEAGGYQVECWTGKEDHRMVYFVVLKKDGKVINTREYNWLDKTDEQIIKASKRKVFCFFGELHNPYERANGFPKVIKHYNTQNFGRLEEFVFGSKEVVDENGYKWRVVKEDLRKGDAWYPDDCVIVYELVESEV